MVSLLVSAVLLFLMVVSAYSFSTGMLTRRMSSRGSTALEALKVGDIPPDFELQDKDGKKVKLSTFRGKKPVVVFFYPNDNSPGCTKEVCAFEKAAPNFKKLGAPVILGISSGKKEDKKKFIALNKLQSMTLLIDDQDAVRKLWEVPRALFGVFPGRVTYTIAKDGTIINIYDDIGKADQHPVVVEQALASM